MIHLLEGTATTGGMGSSIIMIVAMIAIFYFIYLHWNNFVLFISYQCVW